MTTDFAFLHGGGQGGWVWAETIEALRRQAGSRLGKTLALDVPGCGAKRARAQDDMGVEAIATELVADIEAAGLSDVVLVGHSQAGTVLPFMLEQRPGLFRKAVYVSCIAPPPGASSTAEFGAGRRGEVAGEIGWPHDPQSPDRRAFFTAMFGNDMAPAQLEAFLDKLGADQWPARTYGETGWRYGHLGAAPSTFVVCLQDQALPPDWQAVFAERFKVDRRVSVDAAHQVMNTRPETLAEVLLHEAG